MVTKRGVMVSRVPCVHLWNWRRESDIACSSWQNAVFCEETFWQESRLMRSSHNGRSFWESCQISKVYIRSHEIINEPSTSSKHENTVNRMATHLKSNYDTKKNSSGIKLCLKIMITVTWYDFTSGKLHYCVRKRRSSWVIHSDVSSAFRWLLVISPFFHSTKLDWACQTGIRELSQGLPQYCIDVKGIT